MANVWGRVAIVQVVKKMECFKPIFCADYIANFVKIFFEHVKTSKLIFT